MKRSQPIPSSPRPVSALSGLTAVVTGTSRGIGRAVAQTLHAAGAQVAGVSRTGTKGIDGIIDITVDLLDPSGVARAIESVRGAFAAAPDLLVNNAGDFVVAPIGEISPDAFDRMLALNLSAPFRLVHAFVGTMLARGRGHIVTVGSVADHVAFPGNAAYAASKFGLRGLHEVLRAETCGTGVRATLIAPGAVDTALWDALAPATRATFPAAEHMLDAADVADAVLYAVTRPPAVNIDEIRLSPG